MRVVRVHNRSAGHLWRRISQIGRSLILVREVMSWIVVIEAVRVAVTVAILTGRTSLALRRMSLAMRAPRLRPTGVAVLCVIRVSRLHVSVRRVRHDLSILIDFVTRDFRIPELVGHRLQRR